MRINQCGSTNAILARRSLSSRATRGLGAARSVITGERRAAAGKSPEAESSSVLYLLLHPTGPLPSVPLFVPPPSQTKNNRKGLEVTCICTGICVRDTIRRRGKWSALTCLRSVIQCNCKTTSLNLNVGGINRAIQLGRFSRGRHKERDVPCPFENVPGSRSNIVAAMSDGRKSSSSRSSRDSDQCPSTNPPWTAIPLPRASTYGWVIERLMRHGHFDDLDTRGQ